MSASHQQLRPPENAFFRAAAQTNVSSNGSIAIIEMQQMTLEQV
jgi:hypothetical protein